RAAGMRLGADSVDAAVRAATAGQLLQPVVDTDIFEIDRFSLPVALRHGEPLRHHVDGYFFWQKKHSPQAITNGTTTRSPFFRFPDLRSDLDDLPHVFMAHDVAGFHRRLVTVHQMEVRAADRAGGDLDDRVARIL